MMESAWQRPASGTWPAWMGERETPFAEAIDRTKKHVVSSTLESVDWNAERCEATWRERSSASRRSRAKACSWAAWRFPRRRPIRD